MSADLLTAMSTRNADAIAEWLQGIAAREPKMEALELRHCSIDERTRPIQRWEVGQPVEPEQIRLYADEVAQAVTDDCAGLRGPQRYLLSVLRAGVGIVATKPIREGADQNWQLGDPLDTEPVSDRGLAAQAMRHLEIQSRLTMAAMGGMFAALRAENARLQARQDHSEKRDFSRMLATEKLLSEAHQRKLAEAREEANLKDRRRAVDGAVTLAATIANKIAGKEVMPTPHDPAQLQFRALVASWSREQLEQMRFVCTPAQYAVFLDSWEAEIKRREAEEKKENEHLLPDGTDGADKPKGESP